MSNKENKRQSTEPGEKQMPRLTKQNSINSGKPNFSDDPDGFILSLTDEKQHLSPDQQNLHTGSKICALVNCTLLHTYNISVHLSKQLHFFPILLFLYIVHYLI